MKEDKNSPLKRPIENDFDLLRLFKNLKKGKWVLLFFITLSTLLAFMYAYGMTPIYKADTLLQVETQKTTIPGLEELTALSGNETSVGTELVLIKSRKNLSKAIETLKLDIIAYPKRLSFFGNLHKNFFSPNEIKKPPPMWETFDKFAHKYAWGNEYIKVDRLDIPKEWLNKPITLIAKRNNFFELRANENTILKGIVGRPAASTNKHFSLFVSNLRGLPGTEFIVKKLSKRKVISKLYDKVNASEKGKGTGIITLSLTGIDQESIIKTLNKLAETYVEQNKSRNSQEASNALDFLEEQIKPVKESVKKAEATLKNYRTQNRTTDLPQETQAILQVISGIDTELQQYALKREELRRLYTDQHPTLQAIVAQERKLKQLKNKTQSKISKLPKSQQKLFEIEREISVSNSIYVNLLNRIQEFKIAKASTVGSAYIVDTADIDETFIKPSKVKVLALGGLFGLFIGYLFVIIRNSLRQNINDPETLEKSIGIPVYATIPLSKRVKLSGSIGSKNRRQKLLLAETHKNDPAIEGLRSLRTSLHFALHEAKNNVVMFTGPSPNIGKSFVSSNFAVIAAAAGVRVILVDADMRKGYLHEVVKKSLVPGLSDVITQDVPLEEAIQTIDVGDHQIDILTRGQTPPNPSELLMHNEFEHLLNNLSEMYELVIIDTPPVHAVTDPTIIGNHAGVVFMVVLSNKHDIHEIEQAINRLSNAGVETKGFIFNGYTLNNDKHHYAYSYYEGYK